MAGPTAKPFPAAQGVGLTAYVGIKRDFAFKKAFVAGKNHRLAWGEADTKVKYFGISGEGAKDYEQSVRVLSYRPKARSFALQLMGQPGDDTMILYLPGAAQNLMEAMMWVRTWQADWKALSADERNRYALHAGDDLRVPEIELDLSANFTKEFTGNLNFKNQGVPWLVSSAMAEAKLQVDAKGVKFTSTAMMTIKPFAAVADAPQPRRFWCDRPFYLFLWRDGAAWPYAAAWCGNEDFLVK